MKMSEAELGAFRRLALDPDHISIVPSADHGRCTYELRDSALSIKPKGRLQRKTVQALATRGLIMYGNGAYRMTYAGRVVAKEMKLPGAPYPTPDTDKRPCPCGRMGINDCAGECGEPARTQREAR